MWCPRTCPRGSVVASARSAVPSGLRAPARTHRDERHHRDRRGTTARSACARAHNAYSYKAMATIDNSRVSKRTLNSEQWKVTTWHYSARPTASASNLAIGSDGVLFRTLY